MRIDAHQHFWHYSPEAYPWIDADMEPLRRDRLPEDLRPLLEAAGLDGSVAVQARQSMEETEWLLDLAEAHDAVRGVVGWVDLCAPEVEEQLARLAEQPALCGVRHVIQDEPDDDFILREDFQHGVGCLARHGLVYDILIFERHLPRAVEFARRFPDQPFVLDHIAKPRIAHGVLRPWNEHIRHLGALPNVACKISGLVTEADWRHWEPDDFTTYLEVALEAFGPDRVMFGSDWPVCTAAATYAQVVEIVAPVVATLSPDEQAAFWGGTAARVYGLMER